MKWLRFYDEAQAQAMALCVLAPYAASLQIRATVVSASPIPRAIAGNE
jgi:hypothetical protein